MHLDSLVADLALILIVAAIITVIFKKLKPPAVLGYIVAGFLISPHFDYLPTIIDQADISVWADIGVIFLMFGLGLEFSFRKIASVGSSAFTVAVIVMSGMILVGTGIGSLLGWSKMDCIFLGGMLSMSSTMIILKTYEEYNLKNEPFAQMVLGALVIEDVFGIFLLIVLSTISVGRNVSGLDMVSDLGIMLLYLVIWLLLGIFIIPSLIGKIAHMLNDELMLIISLGLCLAMVVLANYIGFSSALGAFIAGSILAGTIQAVRIENLVKPVRDLFGAIFFVSVGMMIIPSLLLKYIGPVLLISAVVICGQMLFATLGILLSGQSLHAAVRGGQSMMQIGEFSFIVATLGMSLGVISDYLYPIIVCVSVITSFLTPIFVKNSERVYHFVNARLPEKAKAFLDRNTSETQIQHDKSTDWNDYVKKTALRTGICSSAMFVCYWVGTRQLAPFMRDVIDSNLTANIVSAAIIILVMAPLANFMHDTNQTLFVKLWVKHRANHLPLITLRGVRVLISACFFALVVRKFFNIPFIVLVLLAAIPIVLIVRSDWINGVSIGMEKQFIANFAERVLAKEKRERGRSQNIHWLDESLYVIEFEVTQADYNETIANFTKRKTFVVTIIRIIRDGQFINMPSANDVVKTGDILQMLGTWDEVDACTILLEKDERIEYTDTDDMILKDYIYGQRFHGVPEEDQLVCVPITIEGGSEYMRKSIKNCGLRNATGGTIIGIERGNLTMVSPDVETILRRGDILWLMGGYPMVDKLIKKGMMDEQK